MATYVEVVPDVDEGHQINEKVAPAVAGCQRNGDRAPPPQARIRLPPPPPTPPLFPLRVSNGLYAHRRCAGGPQPYESRGCLGGDDAAFAGVADAALTPVPPVGAAGCLNHADGAFQPALVVRGGTGGSRG